MKFPKYFGLDHLIIERKAQKMRKFERGISSMKKYVKNVLLLSWIFTKSASHFRACVRVDLILISLSLRAFVTSDFFLMSIAREMLLSVKSDNDIKTWKIHVYALERENMWQLWFFMWKFAHSFTWLFANAKRN